MWEYIKEKEGDTEWLKDALINGTLIGITDGSYNRHKAKILQRLGMDSGMHGIKEYTEGILL